MKKCKKCGAPLEGFLYNTIGKLMGIKPSDSDPEVCNKCVDAPAEEAKETTVDQSPAAPVAEAMEEEKTVVEEPTPMAEEPVATVETPAPAAEEPVVTPEAPAEERKEEEPKL